MWGWDALTISWSLIWAQLIRADSFKAAKLHNPQTSSFILFLEEILGVERRGEQEVEIWTILAVICPPSCSPWNGENRNLCDLIFLAAHGGKGK